MDVGAEIYMDSGLGIMDSRNWTLDNSVPIYIRWRLECENLELNFWGANLGSIRRACRVN
jgi:hypothetical protein